MDKGKFITIEGCEGVGKSTLICLIKDYVEKNKLNVEFTREPGGTIISEEIRGIILNSKNKDMSNTTELLLYEAARRQHVTEKILPLLNRGVTVICDRFTDSTLCYQGYGRGMDLNLINRLNEIAIAPLVINATVYLSANPETGFRRKGGADKNDRLEMAGLEFHQKVFNGFNELAKTESRFIVVDANQDKEQVFLDTISGLKQRNLL